MKNPYVWNEVNPQLFYGRDALLSEMLKGLASSPRCSFGIAGGRRMGKSTLLRRLEKELNTKKTSLHSSGLLVIPIYVDGLSLPRPLSVSDIWTYIFRELQHVFPELSQENIPLDFDLFKEKIGPILKEHPRIIVIFDEIEPILVHDDWAHGFLSHWRALLSNTPNVSEYFTAVFAGAREISAFSLHGCYPFLRIVSVNFDL
jgi:AAA+ ATPase superfamily predicted ATPase